MVMERMEAEAETNQPRRSKRIQELQSKKGLTVEPQKRSKSIDDGKRSNSNNALRRQTRSKSVASERSVASSSTGLVRRPLFDNNNSSTPPKHGKNMHRCTSRSQSTTNANLPSNGPAHRSLLDTNSSVTPPKPSLNSARRYASRSKSTTDANASSDKPTRRSLVDSTVMPSKPSPKTAHRRSKSVTYDSNTASSSNDPGHGLLLDSDASAKSNLKHAHRSHVRSKSVTFERNISKPDHQSMFIDAPIDLTVQNATPSDVHVDISNDDLLPRSSNSVQLASDIELAYENRIENLVESNSAKINRIKELMDERSTLYQQIETLHRINKSLTETVDAFIVDSNQSSNGSEAAARITTLENELEVLRARVDRLNRENFDLRTVNDRLKTSLATHTTKILAEHNYNM